MNDRKKMGLNLMECWETYEKAVVPAGAGRGQRIETRRAFFAGAVSFQGLLLVPTGGDLKGLLDALDSLAVELKDYAEQLAAEISATREARGERGN